MISRFEQLQSIRPEPLALLVGIPLAWLPVENREFILLAVVWPPNASSAALYCRPPAVCARTV